MPFYALKLGYVPDSSYSGFNHQFHDPTNIFTIVLKALEDARILPDKSNVFFASRTDRGVGALNQVISLRSSREPIVSEINSFLTDEIKVIGYTEVEKGFNPRKSALDRTYSYFLVYDDNFCLKRGKKVLDMLKGTHNFQNFAKIEKDKPRSTIKTITEATINEIGKNIIQIRISSQSFLWQQIRRIISHILDVGTNLVEFSQTKMLLTESNVSKKPPPAPPDFLILEKIEYPDIRFNHDQKSLNSFKSYLNRNMRKHSGDLAVKNHLYQILEKY
ncbi:MAG: tRNA pseudouridine synthase A [Candidatus Hodarchaeales archaeon]|jgi:tRNA pseudouridine38-40 synthase